VVFNQENVMTTLVAAVSLALVYLALRVANDRLAARGRRNPWGRR
jgi:hypothetical protein